MPGVKKVLAIDGNAVIVVADTYWHAQGALAAVTTEWDVGELNKVQQATINAMLKEGLDASEAFVGNKAGDAKAAIAGAAKKVEATYSFPYQHHVTMEPMNATARYTADKCEVWCGTQNGEAALAAASKLRACLSPSARSTSCCWAAASAVVAARTMSARPCWSPRKCPARRSS